MTRALLCLFIVSISMASFAGPRAARAQAPERLVLAFYYTWFDEQSWSPDRLPDLPEAAYVSRDRAVMGRHIDQAKAAGIDALVVSWYGPAVANNQTETNLRAMLDEAAARGFRLAVDFEVTSPFYSSASQVQDGLAALLRTHAAHPAYLRWQGKPVVFFWRQNRFDIATWEKLRTAVDPDHGSWWIEEGVDTAPLSVFDGHHLYKTTWNPPADLAYTAGKFAARVRSAADKYGKPKVYAANVMPGWDDRKLGRADSFGISREDGAYYERSWQAAIASNPDWVIITSFNEWPEGTYIEPSRQYGDRYLKLTSKWSAVFHAGEPVGQQTEATPARVSATPTLSPPVRAAAPVEPPAATPAPPRPSRMAASPVELREWAELLDAGEPGSPCDRRWGGLFAG